MSDGRLDIDEADDAEQRSRSLPTTGVPDVLVEPVGSDVIAHSGGLVGVGAVNEPGEVEQPGAVARELFGSTLPSALRYAELLANEGVIHGHIGPRELPRLWSRHLMNCAVVSDLLPTGAALVDVGSGAGLPGLPIAIRRVDLSVTLVEAMQRRADFLMRCVKELDLGDRVTVVRGRVDDPMVVRSLGRQRWVTARAVAPLDRLVGWCIPLLDRSGELLAMKGDRACDEVERDADAVARLGGQVRSVLRLFAGDEVTRVVVVGRRDGSVTRRDDAHGRRDARGGRQSEGRRG